MRVAVSYSKDLRERVMAYMDSGRTREAACQVFLISEKTLYNWKNLRKKSGSLLPLKTGSKGHRQLSYEALTEYVEKLPDQTLHEMGEVFNVSYRTILYYLCPKTMNGHSP